MTDAKAIRDIAIAAEQYARARKLGAEAERYAAEIATRAERRIGELLGGTPKAPSGWSARQSSGSGAIPEDPAPGSSYGKKVSARSQQLAGIPDAEFERRMADERLKASADRLARMQRDHIAEQRRVGKRASGSRVSSSGPGPISASATSARCSPGCAASTRLSPTRHTSGPRCRCSPTSPGGPIPCSPPAACSPCCSGRPTCPTFTGCSAAPAPTAGHAGYLTPGPATAIHAARVQSNWKPLLIYGGGPGSAT